MILEEEKIRILKLKNTHGNWLVVDNEFHFYGCDGENFITTQGLFSFITN
jgi:hypothetical protein